MRNIADRTIPIGAGVLVGRSIGPFFVGAFVGLGEGGSLLVRILRDDSLEDAPSSFPSNDVHVSRDVLPRLTPQAANDDHLASTRRFATGQVVAVSSDGSSWMSYSVAEDVLISPLPGEARPSVVKARRWDPSGGAVGDVMELKYDDVVEVFTLTWRAEFKCNAPRDPMYKFMAIPVLERWTSGEGVAMTVTTETETVHGSGTMTMDADGVKATFTHDPRKRFGPAKREISDVDLLLSDAVIEPHIKGDRGWRADHSYLHGLADFGDLEGRAYSLRVAFDEGPTAAIRESFRGAEFKAFSHRVFRDDPDPIELICAPNVFIVEAFGRKARVYNPAFTDGVGMAIIYEGDRFDRDQTLALRSLMNFLAGRRLRHVSTESLTDSRLVAFEYHEVGEATKRGLPALKIEHQARAPILLADQFARMLDEICALRRSAPMKLDSTFHHYYEGANSNYPTSRILMFAVAIDALAALWWGRQTRPGVIDRDVFSNEILPPVQRAMKAALRASNIVDSPADQLFGKLGYLNEVSSRKKQAAFWEHVGIALTREEDSVLATRHDVVHEGHVGDDADEATLLLNERRSGILANLFNRAMLRLIGWNGPYRDALSGEERD